MKIDLSIITKSINKELTQEADISLTSFRSRLGDFPIVRKAPVTLQIRNEENAAVFVKGTVDIDVMIPCARCLEEVRTPIRFDIDKKLTVREEGLVDEETSRSHSCTCPPLSSGACRGSGVLRTSARCYAPCAAPVAACCP